MTLTEIHQRLLLIDESRDDIGRAKRLKDALYRDFIRWLSECGAGGDNIAVKAYEVLKAEE